MPRVLVLTVLRWCEPPWGSFTLGASICPTARKWRVTLCGTATNPTRCDRLAVLRRRQLADAAGHGVGRARGGRTALRQLAHGRARGQVDHERQPGGDVRAPVAQRPQVVDRVPGLVHPGAQVELGLARLLGQVGPRAEVRGLDRLQQQLDVGVADRAVALLVDRVLGRELAVVEPGLDAGQVLVRRDLLGRPVVVGGKDLPAPAGAAEALLEDGDVVARLHPERARVGDVVDVDAVGRRQGRLERGGDRLPLAGRHRAHDAELDVQRLAVGGVAAQLDLVDQAPDRGGEPSRAGRVEHGLVPAVLVRNGGGGVVERRAEGDVPRSRDGREREHADDDAWEQRKAQHPETPPPGTPVWCRTPEWLQILNQIESRHGDVSQLLSESNKNRCETRRGTGQQRHLLREGHARLPRRRILARNQRKRCSTPPTNWRTWCASRMPSASTAPA